MNDKVRTAYTVSRALTDEIAAEAEDLEVTIRSHQGQKPFQGMEDYYPHVLRGVDALKSGPVRRDVLEYAAAGVPVFPVHSVRNGRCTCGRAECKDIGKHPRTMHGFKDATTDPKRVPAYWQRWPDANIGMPTGKASGVCAVDIDPRNGGQQSWQELQAKVGPLPATLIQKSGGGGQHYLFRHPGCRLPAALADGIDLKGDGGYILVPPSLHLSGKVYQWTRKDPVNCLSKLPALPQTLLDTRAAGNRGPQTNFRKGPGTRD
ncbi:MAG: bifunctional DNA primase/polymerase [Bryobacterales bacterium]|nr:bifunctional DNA primase/polymerase [Bryobacterales bacterium]